MVKDAVIQSILNDYSKYTKEEYEVVNTYIVKKEAEYEVKRAEKIANTDVKYLVKRKYVDKYFDMSLKHKEMLLNSSLEEFNAHKEVVLQCLSIMQSLVQNPNVLDTLLNIVNSEWYSGQDFKQYITSILQNELLKMNEIHTELYNLRNCPALLFIPELYATENIQLSQLPSYIDPEGRNLEEFSTMTNENYPLLP